MAKPMEELWFRVRDRLEIIPAAEECARFVFYTGLQAMLTAPRHLTDSEYQRHMKQHWENISLRLKLGPDNIRCAGTVYRAATVELRDLTSGWMLLPRKQLNKNITAMVRDLSRQLGEKTPDCLQLTM